jgi:hypothetical protein
LNIWLRCSGAITAALVSLRSQNAGGAAAAPKRPVPQLYANTVGSHAGILLALALALALGAAWAVRHRLSGDATTSEIKTPPSHPRIAVLPFENLSPDVSNGFFAEGVHEELLDDTREQHAPGST